VIGVVAALVGAIACVGLGGALLRDADIDEALVAGVGALGLLLLPFTNGLALPVLLGGSLILAATGWLRRPTIRWPGMPWPTLLLLVPLVLAAGVVALGAPTDTDEVYQHLALPKQLLNEGRLPTGELRPNAARPLGLHLVYTTVMALGGATAAKTLHLVMGVLLLLRTEAIARRMGGAAAGFVAVAAMAGSYTVVRELGLAYNNLPTALACLLALDACLGGRGWRMALFGAVALSLKYTAAPVLAGIWLVYLFRTRRFKETLATGGAAIAAVVPWWIRNAADGLHPLFPFAGWEAQDRFEFAFLDRYGMGREWTDLLLLPWNATVHAETTSYVFLGRISPVFLLGAALVIWPVLRRRGELAAAAAVALVGCIGWAAGPHWLRYLLPTLPILAVLTGVGATTLPKRIGVVLCLAVVGAGLPSNLGPWIPQIPIDEPRAEAIPGHSAARFASERLPQDSKVAVLFAWPDWYLDVPYVLSSVEDHVPTRHWLYVHGDDSLEALRAEGVTHVLVGRVNFIHKSYPFLSDEQFHEQFEVPEAQLAELLLADGVLLFEDNRYAVWRLQP